MDTTVPAALAPLAPPGALVLGRYRLHERLGAGGFGIVWRAEDELLHREVALKQIALPADGDHERARREALATARLAHPAIVALYEAHVDGEEFWLVSELVHGQTLARLIAADALADEEILEIGVALAHALAHAHARGVVHRDVKPQNVLVPDARTERDVPAKLTDFGGARLSGVDALTHTGETLGTLAYMAPEQSEGFEADAQADLYSLALVLYEALTGANPVRGATPAATVRKIGRPVPSLRAARPELPLPLAHALDTALAPDPCDRGTVERLRAALESALAAGVAASADDARTRRLRARRARTDRSTFAHATRAADAAHLALPSPLTADDPEPSTHPRRPEVAPPRSVWLGCALAAIVWQLVSGRAGVALLLGVAAVPLVATALARRSTGVGIGWLAGMLAPALGLAGLAGAFPALAGQARRWSRRALLGALGYWWLTLAEPLLAGVSSGGRLWLGPSAAAPPRAVWEGSLTNAAVHVLAPMLTVGLLLGAALWAAAATLLPWLVRGRSAVLDALAAVVWAGALLAATPYFDSGLPSAAAANPAHPRGLVLGTILAAALTIAARALRGPVRGVSP